jgi:hypothetical protein
MEQLEVITAIGEGVWGNHKYQVALKTRACTYHDALHQSTRKVLRYLFSFGPSISISDSRSFRTEEKRRVFMAESFSALSMSEIAESNRQWKQLTSPLQSVVDHKLTTVSFVEDYLQLDFSPYRFLVYNWPDISMDGKTLQLSDQGYSDSLLSFVGKQVSGFDEYLDKGLVIGFSDGSSISVPLRVSAEFPSPEVAGLSGPNINAFIWPAN